jgi:hypothetical protein
MEKTFVSLINLYVGFAQLKKNVIGKKNNKK